ncbi:carbohydrate binding domain-containing protein [Empedobacter sp. UBA7248]|uniref:carbohydrate binding domain-containing protein n=1 Tax=Empedobacter sp. UBA7248 TaxID=1946448 RepID=UPI0025BBC609|nr:carbohydrate binding domain-containing protein [Empedobacter sp. UBA7248]
MKLNIKKNLIGLLALFALQQTNAQVIFKEDFGQSNTRKSSPYVPQAGNDLNLQVSPYTCTPYYRAATSYYVDATRPTCKDNPVGTPTSGYGLTNYNGWLKNVSDGYYVIVAPANLKDVFDNGTAGTGSWWLSVSDHTANTNGAVMVVNAGTIRNQYYRRAVKLKSGTTYKLSVWVMGNGSSVFDLKMEAQNILTEQLLGSNLTGNNQKTLKLSEANKWEQLFWTFTTPTDQNCNTDIAVSLRNNYTTNETGNDFYIDDIVLEEVVDPSADIIDCNPQNGVIDDIIKANDDAFTTTLKGGVYSIIGNDSYSKVVGNIVLNGTGKNSSIIPLGIWPTGYSIDTNGQLVIAANAPALTNPLEYQITNLLGVSSIAKITVKQDLGVPFLGNEDRYYWDSSKEQVYDVLSNDTYNGGEPGSGFVFSGKDQNMTISMKGTWPSGITLNSLGQIVINQGVKKPESAIFYTLCNMNGNCQDIQVTFLGDEGPFNPGTITTTRNTCYDGSIEVVNVEKASYIAYLMSYNWQASVDNGATWQDFGALSEKEDQKDQSIGNVIIQKGDKLIINGLRKETLVRRQAKTIGLNRYAYTSPVLVTPSEENTITLPDNINAFAAEQGTSFTFPTVSTKFPSTITIYDSEGKEVGNKISNLKKGDYSFTIKATTTAEAPMVGCETFTSIQLIVYDLKDCDIVKKKIFATDVRDWSSGLSGVVNKEKAVNGNRADYATITGGVVILGIGTVGVDLYFTKLSDPNDPKSKRVLYTAEELKGKKVSIKLGEQYSGLKVAGGLSVVGRYTSATDPNDIGLTSGIPIGITNENAGTSFGVKGGVLDLLKGDNVFDFSFIPAKSNGTHVAYNGVRVQLGSLLSVADLATVFHAYIEEEELVTDPNYKPLGDITVNPPSSLLYPIVQKDIDGTDLTDIKNVDIKLNEFTHDVTWGNRSEVLNVASGLSSVVHPYYAVDDNYDSYTLFNATAGVLNQQFLRTHLRQAARPGDQIQVTLAYPNINVLNLSLLQLGNFKIVYYLGDTKVGEENMEKFRILDIGLFNFKNKRRAVISKPITIPFDSFEIQQFNTVSVNLGDGLHVHDIRVAPMMLFEGQEDSKEVTKICAADFLAIKSPDFCTEYEISFAKVVKFGGIYTLPDEDEDPDNNLPLLDKDGNPIKEILEVEDILNSQLKYSHSGAAVMYYNIDRLYTEFENEGIILVKVQTKRQGVNYGNPQYLRVKLENCQEALVNPVIRLSN